MANIRIFIVQLFGLIRSVFKGKVPEPQPSSSTELQQPPQTEKPPLPSFAEAVVKYMEEHEYDIDRTVGAVNIVYVSGVGTSLDKNSDERDGWNDVRALLSFTSKGMPFVFYVAAASTAPGEISRSSTAAKRLGGVATVVPGQYRAWKMGFHKGKKSHPALVQCAPVMIWRDSTADGYKDGEKIYKGMFGINQHSTAPGFSGEKVGAHSAGCLVGKHWEGHLEFIKLLKSTTDYIKDPEHVFTTTVISGSDLPDWE